MRIVVFIACMDEEDIKPRILEDMLGQFRILRKQFNNAADQYKFDQNGMKSWALNELQANYGAFRQNVLSVTNQADALIRLSNVEDRPWDVWVEYNHPSVALDDLQRGKIVSYEQAYRERRDKILLGCERSEALLGEAYEIELRRVSNLARQSVNTNLTLFRKYGLPENTAGILSQKFEQSVADFMRWAKLNSQDAQHEKWPETYGNDNYMHSVFDRWYDSKNMPLV